MFAASRNPAPPGPQGGPRRNPGDLGRRVARRRRELGLGIETLAERADMTPGFVDWIETRPAELSPGELTRLAAALETTRVDLLGGDRDVAPGRAGPDRRTRTFDLTEEECRGRLGRRGVGRVVFQMGGALIVRPVNYRVADGVVLFRSEAAGALAEAVGRRVVLEVDHLDEVQAEGWSVLVTGVAEAGRRDVDRPGTREEEPQPWADGRRDLLVRIHPNRITGRELRHSAGPLTTTEP
jgi:transcriptional regulator with XRE-family HTH domain